MKEHRMQRRTLLAGATAAGLAMATGGSWAQSAWPNKPVNLVVPFPAGVAPMPLPAPWPHSFPRSRARRW